MIRMARHLVVASSVLSALAGSAGCAASEDTDSPSQDTSAAATASRKFVPFRYLESCPTKSKTVKVAFFDADSTLRVSRSGLPTSANAADVEVLPMVAKTTARLSKAGYLITVISNQGGVGEDKNRFQEDPPRAQGLIFG